MMWGWDDDKRLGDWSIVDRHRKRVYAEGVRDGVIVGCVIAVFSGVILSWIFCK